MKDIIFLEKFPSAEDYNKLRKEIGWRTYDDEIVSKGIKNSNYCLCVECEDELIGFGRVIGDGATAIYIQDVMVLPKYQKVGIGKQIMKKIIKYININYSDKIFVGLIAEKGLEKFYGEFGFSHNEVNHFYRY